MIFTFELQVTPILHTKFPVNRPFGSEEEEVQSRFSRCWLWWPSLISDQNILAYFFKTSKFRVNWPFCSGNEVQNDFQELDGSHGLQVTPILPIKL